MKKIDLKEKFKKASPFIIIGALVLFGAGVFFFAPINKIIDSVRKTTKQIVLKNNAKKMIVPELKARDAVRDEKFSAPIPRFIEKVETAAQAKEKVDAVSVYIDAIINWAQKLVGILSGGVAILVAKKNLAKKPAEEPATEPAPAKPKKSPTLYPKKNKKK